jgi:hypothetical protein
VAPVAVRGAPRKLPFMDNRRIMRALAAAICLFAGSGIAMAATPGSVAFRHELNRCMTRHMVADRRLSYNDAARLCRDQLRDGSPEKLAANGAAGKLATRAPP